MIVAASRVSGEVIPARAQMATTLGFHIILACLGIALPAIVLVAEFIGQRPRQLCVAPAAAPGSHEGPGFRGSCRPETGYLVPARTTDGARTWTDVTPPAATALLRTPDAAVVLDALDGNRAYLAVTAATTQNAPELPTVVFGTSNGGRPPCIPAGQAARRWKGRQLTGAGSKSRVRPFLLQGLESGKSRDVSGPRRCRSGYQSSGGFVLGSWSIL